MFDEFDFDVTKDAINVVKHGLSFKAFGGFDTPIAVVADKRTDYGEQRYRAFGRIEGLGFMVAFTMRNDRPRIFSFRRAHEKEMKRYGFGSETLGTS